jgi:hypothetical protein
VRLEGLGQLKNPVTQSGTEPATFWLVLVFKLFQLLLIIFVHISIFFLNFDSFQKSKEWEDA